MNKNYVIIGGSSGIGKELVNILASQENNVFATYNENKVENHDKVQYQKFNVLNDFNLSL
jgi:NAD(P)-dependent dehydrogenase (short-subunit alcohol dehydrogenase family)